MAGDRFTFTTYSDDNRGTVVKSDDQKNKQANGTGVVQGNIQFDSPIHGIGVVPIGSLVSWAGTNNQNPGWLLCNGRSLNKNTYAQLFNAIKYTYGGSGNNFNLPDLRGRVVAGLSNNNDVLTGAMNLGQKKGSQTHTLTTAEMPKHSHPYVDTYYREAWGKGGSRGLGSSASDSDNYDYNYSRTTSTTGSSHSHNNVQPTIVLNYLIRVY